MPDSKSGLKIIDTVKDFNGMSKVSNNERDVQVVYSKHILCNDINLGFYECQRFNIFQLKLWQMVRKNWISVAAMLIHLFIRAVECVSRRILIHPRIISVGGRFFNWHWFIARLYFTAQETPACPL